MGYTSEDGLILIGGGGHALVVAEAAAMSGRPIRGFLDDDAAAALGTAEGILTGPGSPVLRIERLGGMADAADLTRFGRCEVILAIGDLRARRERIAGLGALPKGVKLATIVHPRAIVSPSATIEAGVFVGPGAVVHTRARIGAHAIINSGAIVEHECRIGENVHVAPGAALGGRVSVEADTLMGIGSRVLPNMQIGRGSTIGAGAVVVRRVGRLTTVVGIPGLDRDTD